MSREKSMRLRRNGLRALIVNLNRKKTASAKLQVSILRQELRTITL